MINILHLRSSFNPGGTETTLLRLYNYSQSQLCFHYYLLKEGSYVQLLNSNTNKSILDLRKRKLDIKLLFRLFEYVRKNNVSIIHTHQEIELFYAIFLKIPLKNLSIVHTINRDNNSRDFNYLAELLMVRFTDKVIAVSNTLKGNLINRKYPRNKIRVIYQPVLINALKDEEDSSFKKSINYNSDDFIILMIGNFVVEKRQDLLIKAFNLLKYKYPQTKLVLIGKENRNIEMVKSLVSIDDLDSRVFFTGPIQNAASLIQICDLFVMSSDSETFSLVVVEAMLSKKPILASDIDVMQELSWYGKYYELFDRSSVTDLSNKIEFYINNRNSEMIERAYNYAVTEFSSVEKYYENLRKVYNEVLKKEA